jgi:hypothetical protein
VIRQFAPVVVTLGLLGYIAGFAHLEVTTTGVAEFRERSKAAMFAVPRKVGDWVAESVEIDAKAKELLQANAGFSFRYRDNRGREAIYMVVQVRDARHMSGHAPVHCYPGTGWTILSQTPKTWELGDAAGEIEIHGTEYRMRRLTSGGLDQVWNVRHFFVFPDGTIGSTLGEVDAAAEDYRRLAYGVTQVQFITPDVMPQGQREQAFKELVGSERSLEMFRVLRTGIPK